MRNSFSLGNFLGIDLRADFSWLIGFGVLVWMLAAHYFPMNYSGWIPAATFAAALATAVIFFASVLAHELAHSLVSKRLGLPVPRITLFIFGGMAQLGREPNRPRDEFLSPLLVPCRAYCSHLAYWPGPGLGL